MRERASDTAIRINSAHLCIQHSYGSSKSLLVCRGAVGGTRMWRWLSADMGNSCARTIGKSNPNFALWNKNIRCDSRANSVRFSAPHSTLWGKKNRPTLSFSECGGVLDGLASIESSSENSIKPRVLLFLLGLCSPVCSPV